MRWELDLVRDIRFNDYRDDIDFPIPETTSSFYDGSNGEFTKCNHEELIKQFSSISSRCKAILEIGIARSEQGSSYTLIKNKTKDCIYIGVDIRDCSFLNDPENNVFTLQTRSENMSEVLDFLKSKNITLLDFIFIDGWHSINQVYLEWEYTKMLSSFGVVGFHDSNNHPGPKLFVENLNDSWVISKSCSNDHGISFVWKK